MKSETGDVEGVTFLHYFKVKNDEYSEILSNKIFKSNFKRFLADDNILIMISSNRWKDVMMEKLEGTSFDM